MVRFSKAYWLVICLMVLTFFVNAWLQTPTPATDRPVRLQDFPKQINGWRAEEQTLGSEIEQVLRTDQAKLERYFDRNGRMVELFVGYYQNQKFGAQVHSPQHCLPGSGWTIMRRERFRLPFDNQVSYANKLYINKNHDNQFVLYWFSTGEAVIQDELDLKIRLLLNSLRHRSTSVYFYRVCVPFAAQEEEQALALLAEFANTVLPYFEQESSPAETRQGRGL